MSAHAPGSPPARRPASSAATPCSPAALGALDRAAFVERLGWVYEGSPWVAEAAWEQRPFATRAALARAFAGVVRGAPRERQVALVRAHPALGVRAARDAQLTPASADEQAAAGLDRLAPADHERLTAEQRAYRERFGFPYVVCVGEHTVRSILTDLRRRLAHEREAELETALDQIERIAALRLRAAVTERREESESR